MRHVRPLTRRARPLEPSAPAPEQCQTHNRTHPPAPDPCAMQRTPGRRTRTPARTLLAQLGRAADGAARAAVLGRATGRPAGALPAGGQGGAGRDVKLDAPKGRGRAPSCARSPGGTPGRGGAAARDDRLRGSKNGGGEGEGEGGGIGRASCPQHKLQHKCDGPHPTTSHHAACTLLGSAPEGTHQRAALHCQLMQLAFTSPSSSSVHVMHANASWCPLGGAPGAAGCRRCRPSRRRRWQARSAARWAARRWGLLQGAGGGECKESVVGGRGRSEGWP